MNRPVPRVGSLSIAVVGALLVLAAGVVAWKDHVTPESAAPENPTVSSHVHLSGSKGQIRAPAPLDDVIAKVDGDNKNGNWGDVKGQVVLDAPTVPARAELSVSQDQAACLANGPLLGEDLLVNKSNMGVKNVYVWLMPVDASKPLAIHPELKKIKQKTVEIDQPCCMFVPHAVALRAGQELLTKNSSKISHNMHWTGHPLKNPGGNQAIPSGGQLKIDDLASDRYPVALNCDIHPWMKGWVRVFDHPYFALTDADGKFEIKNAPAGPCRVMIWQESKGWVYDDRDADGKVVGKSFAIPAGKALDLGVVKMAPP